MKKCKICGNNTNIIFNIDLKAIHICENCATSIFIQQAVWYTQIPKEILNTNINK